MSKPSKHLVAQLRVDIALRVSVALVSGVSSYLVGIVV